MRFCPLCMRLKTTRHPSKKTATAAPGAESFPCQEWDQMKMFIISLIESLRRRPAAPRVCLSCFQSPVVEAFGESWELKSGCQVNVVIETASVWRRISLRSRCVKVTLWSKRERENDSGIQSASCKHTNAALIGVIHGVWKLKLLCLLCCWGAWEKHFWRFLALFWFWAHPIKRHGYISLVFVGTGSNPN